MAQNIQIAGATFNAVPSIVVPVAGGGSATFVDPSPTTAAATDVVSGKLFFDALGVLTQGTGSGTFVVTVSYNDSTDNWEPTCTFAQIADAYAAGKTILVRTDSPDAAADGLYKYDSPGDEWLEYLVGESYTDAGGRKIYFQKLIYNEFGLYRQATDVYLYPVGAYTVSAAGTIDIAEYASVSVPAGTAGTPSASKGTVSNHSVSVTPSVTNQTGWITGSTKTGTAVTVTAAELESGTKSITQNGTGIDVTGYAAVDVAVPTGSSKNVQVVQSTSRTTSTTLAKVSGSITVSKTGTYDIYWSACRTNTSSSYTWGTRMYIGNTAYGTENTTWSNNTQNNHLTNVSLTANDVISVYARGRGGSYYAMVPMLLIIES